MIKLLRLLLVMPGVVDSLSQQILVHQPTEHASARP